MIHFMDRRGKQLGLLRAVEKSKERRAPLEEGTLATEKSLGGALAYRQDKDHGPKPFCGQDFSTLFLSSATTWLRDRGVASAEQHA